MHIPFRILISLNFIEFLFLSNCYELRKVKRYIKQHDYVILIAYELHNFQLKSSEQSKIHLFSN